MNVKLSPVGHGNHENLHFVFKIGNKKKEHLIKIKIVGFINSGNAYITDCSFKLNKDYFNLSFIKKIIELKLKKFDFNLIFSESDWLNSKLSTEDILNKL